MDTVLSLQFLNDVLTSFPDFYVIYPVSLEKKNLKRRMRFKYIVLTK